MMDGEEKEDVQISAPMKSSLVRGEIHLEVRRGDKLVNAKELEQFDLFRRMKKKVPVGRVTGAVVLRSYRKGEIVFQQGQVGGTAFYVSTALDLARLKAVNEGKQPSDEAAVDPERDRHILSAMIISSTSQSRPRGLFERWFSPAVKTNVSGITSIPSDGPTDIDYDTREAPLLEGDLFGEMSCISYTPRSATVIARVDCQLLEFNRNVFDLLRDDPNHQAAVGAEYRRRTLETHLRQFELFRDLTDAQIQTLKDNVELEIVPPGRVICEEGEKWSDSKPLDVFIVRNGVVQVTMHHRLSLRMDDIPNWTALCRELDGSQPNPKIPAVASEPMQTLGKRLDSRSSAGSSTPDRLSSVERTKAQEVESGKSPGPATSTTDQPEATSSVEKATAVDLVPKKLSPLEQMRAKKAAATVKELGATTDSLNQTAITSGAENPAEVDSAPKKLSPIEQMRAKQAAAAAAKESVTTAASPTQPEIASGAEKPAEVDSGAKKLSPIEAMRARNVAASATKETATPQKSVPVSVSVIQPPQILRAAKTAPDDPRVPLGSSPEKSTAKLPLLRKPQSDQSGSPCFLVKSWLNDQVLEAIRQIANEELQGASLHEARELVLDALNELLGNQSFLSDKRLVADIYSKPEILRKTATFPKGIKGIEKNWSELELRTTGRAAMSEILPDLILKPIQSSRPPRVLTYLSRGDCFGEIAVVNRESRTATCIAYSHPSTEDAREYGDVELVRIRGSVFLKLMEESPKLKNAVETIAKKRIHQDQVLEERHTESDLIASTEFQQMGLFQGSRLLVIDLDSCTRCGDCVEACVSTHDDGYSRLFLDGPRYDRFLVPSACRSCLNPVCMIGCPVGSIGRGENGQIEIRDWCIGCSVCADQCPYDSIQMHDLGLIPEESSGWLCANRRSLSEDWFAARRLGGGWMQGKSPFLWQGEFLRYWSTAEQDSSDSESLDLCFRHEFRLPKKSQSSHFRLSINDDRRKSSCQKVRVKKSSIVAVWLNGKRLDWSGNSLDLALDQFSRAENVLALEVTVDTPAEYGQFVLSACLDSIPLAGKQTLEVLGKDVRPEMDLVTSRAAVCDLCSHIPSQQPACVTSCPHDAAIRINPLVNFPT